MGFFRAVVRSTGITMTTPTEVMARAQGSGVVRDHDGEYEYQPGEFFMFPANVEHAIHNPTTSDYE